MDFIWDGNRNLVRKTAWWADGLPNGQPSKTQVHMCMVYGNLRYALRSIWGRACFSQLSSITRCDALLSVVECCIALCIACFHRNATPSLHFQGIFQSVPNPKAGGLRISYINMHQASQFQDRMNRVMKSGTPWLKANPRLQIWEEWSGQWSDSGVSQSVHEGNLQYLKNRQAKEGELTQQ
jgi:hypothetical protein